jgi:hypothetical protein
MIGCAPRLNFEERFVARLTLTAFHNFLVDFRASEPPLGESNNLLERHTYVGALRGL